MSAQWAAVVAAIVVPSGGFLYLAGRVSATLDQLRQIVADHEGRLRNVELHRGQG